MTAPSQLTLPQATAQALAAYNGGDWATAERLCRLVIAAKSDYFDALNILGAIAAQSQRLAEAADWLGRAVAAKPDEASAHYHLGVVLRKRGEFETALARSQPGAG